MFVDRVYTAHNHVETFCIKCGNRKFYHNSQSKEALWLMETEKTRIKALIFQ